jgi:hypothetical protein
MALDDALQAAKDGKYLLDASEMEGGEQTVGHNELLELIDEEARGKKQYQVGKDEGAKGPSKDELEHQFHGELDAALAEVGIDPKTGESPHDALGRAATKMLEEHAERTAIRRRTEHLNMLKEIRVRQFVDAAPSELIGIEAKLVGVKTTKEGWANGASIAGRGAMLADRYGKGLDGDLERAGLSKVWESGQITKDIERELRELNLRNPLGDATGNRERPRTPRRSRSPS